MISDRFKIIKHFTLLACIGISLGTVLPSYGQHNVHIKASSLDHSTQGTPIAGAIISKDQGDVVKVTDANGDAILTNVDGTMSIKAMHPDYKQFEQTFNITSDTTLYFAMPKNIRPGPWGDDTLNADWWKLLYSDISSTQDPLHWKQLIPVNVRIEGASVADSLNIIAAMNTMSTSTGYNLFNVVSPTVTKDTTFTVYMNASTNASELIPNINIIAYKGYSKISNSELKRITHEIVKSQDGWPTAAIPVLSNSNPSIQDMPLWQPIDGSYLSLKLEQDFRVAGKKQHLRIGNMQNYVALGSVGLVSITSPANGATDLDTLLNILGAKDANAMWYDFKITTDAAGNNVFIAQNGVDRPRINVDLEPGKTYFLFERARNNTSTGSWPTPVQISTKALIITYKEDILIGSNAIAYPNPTSKDITIKFYLAQGSIINIFLYNYSGKELTCDTFAESSGSQSHTIDLTSFGKGTFFLKLVTHDSGRVRLLRTIKFIKN